MKKKATLVLIIIMAMTLIFAMTPATMAAGNDAMIVENVQSVAVENIQNPVKVQADVFSNDTVNYESEAIIPTGDSVAGEESGETPQIDGFYTWAALGTYSGMVTFVIFATEMLKKLKFLAAVKNQIVSYVVALLGLICVTVFTGKATLPGLMLCIFNALIVSLAANGLFDSVTKNVVSASTETNEASAGYEKL